MPSVLLLTDVYKTGHLEQYPKNTEYIYSYLEARKPGTSVVFYGLQYYLIEYLSKPLAQDDADEFVKFYEKILGPCPQSTKDKVESLVNDLGFWPLSIKAVPEGSVVESGNILMSITNTLPGYHWCVGMLESLFLKLWNSCTVATGSLKYKQLVTRYAQETCDNFDHLPFSVHCFGYRGVSSEETAQISGSAHLVNFLGSDTIPAVWFIDKYYSYNLESNNVPIGLSVPASEHSVMCAFGPENEYEAFDNMLETYPTGIVSIVSDTFDYFKILTDYLPTRKQQILERDGKVVIRPDSGNPLKIICGDPEADPNSPEFKGSLELLWDLFGGTINEKGYKVLNPKIGLIYGDGMYYERFETILSKIKEKGFASSNLVIGVGGLLLQNHSRDDFGFAIKASYIIRDGKPLGIVKNPKTDPGKKSKKGLMKLIKENGKYKTIDLCSPEEEETGLLEQVFLNGQITKYTNIEEIRKNIINDLKEKENHEDESRDKNTNCKI